ncbi:TonB-dependent receptor [Pedobacter sp. SD-b]|uniref:TonB-dependent receptor n=1 Tax=Pedobacter segetis TaxID=2793069 RepID=A0ABS1BM04_9SPHI|nr:TonB-dependent receptor [Pedobacter segetis]MBK0383843.1 TonB-dependent receptor [Pedobacter segetis]
MKRIILSFVAVFATIFAYAQTTLTVNVKNAEGEGLANIEVTITSKNLNKSAPTNASGAALFQNLPSGNYVAKVKSSINYNANNINFYIPTGKPEKSVDLVLTSKDSYQLQEVAITENKNKSVTINKTDAAVAQYISKSQIQTLPIEGRDVTKSLYRLPNITISSLGYNEAPSIAINGLSGIYTNYLIDGMDNNERFLGNSKFNTPFGFTESVTVLTNNYSVEYGNTSNGIVNVETRSGSNDFTGEVFYLTRPGSIVDAKSAFASVDLYGNPVKDGFQRQQLGVGVGGPIVKDKTFFYFNLEQTNDIKDNLLNVPQLGVNEAVRGRNYFTYASGKIDQYWNKNFHSSLRANVGSFDIDAQGGGLTGGNNFPSSGSTQKNRTYLIALKNDYNISPKLKAETNVQTSFFRWNYRDRPNIGKPGVSVQDPSGVTIANIGSIDYIFDDGEYTNQLQQKFRYKAGKHNLLGGAEFTTSDFSLLGAGNSYGYYTVRLNAQQLADLKAKNIGAALDINDIPSDVQVIQYKVDLDQKVFGVRQNVFNIYAEDNFKATDKLDINLGVRYDYDNLSKAGDTKGDRNNIGPRFSFNYKIDDKNVIRGGVGRFYDKIKYSVTSDNLQFSGNSPNFKKELAELQRLGILDKNANLDRITYPGNLRAIYEQGSTPGYLQGKSSAESQGNRDFQSNSNFRIKNPNGYQNPYSDQFTLGYQRKLADNILFDVDLVASNTNDLYRITNLNSPPPFDPKQVGSVRTTANANSLRPVPIKTVNGQFVATVGGQDLSGIARDVYMTETAGKARYAAANFSFIKTKGEGEKFSYRFSYTLSSIKDDTEGINVRAQDANNWAAEYAYGDNDRTHVINALFTYYPIKNLTLTPAMLFQSGQPITRYAIASQYGGVTDLNGNGESQGLPADIQPGETRNNDRLPSATSFDFSAKYRLTLKNKSGIEFSADIYNLLNSTNLTGFASTRSASNQIQPGPKSSNVLNIRAAGPPRQFQFGVRYVFGNF